ncbi:MAG: DUF4375 domain-containing protein [Erysipelothrix sp.]|jgi:hypothetical protein|nr:DUF4375 domain-containing protein [Erysipelothrix sp.]
MGLLKKLLSKKTYQTQTTLSPEATRWNKFIFEVCNREIPSLSITQRSAVLAFWYDAEMNNGGHSGYFDCYSDIHPDDLVDALNAINASAFAENFIEAIKWGIKDDYEKTDNTFYQLMTSLSDFLMEYVELHKDDIFD